ncbi:MAG: glycosyltransferase family 4 protein [Dehalococcoidia bacterium]|nr:glycosyltransferase family 4 protein [Dehalococcoidia bacterium]
MNHKRISSISKIAVIGNYLPRQCGIATFTTDICNALAMELKNDQDVVAVAMNDIPGGYDYPERVKFSVRANVQADYFRAADYINVNQYEVTVLQHEYGIFGGPAGSHILHALKALHMPIITTLHTVLQQPSVEQRVIIEEIADYSDRLVVMTHKAIDFLTEVYGIPASRIALIPHGIPDVSFKQPGIYNDLFGLKGKDIILTFGLLGPGKGIETMIETMPAIISKHPEAVYVILGQTHPHVREVDGDAYHYGLQQLVNRLGLREHVLFHNYFVPLDTLVQYLQTAKVYVAPYPNKEQITSGTLSYAVGVGAPVVSTPFWHAEELLAEGRGRIVPFNDPEAMAEGIIELLENDQERNMMRFTAYQHGRSMTWKEVARQYLSLMTDILARSKPIPKDLVVARQSYKLLNELPEINLSHLRAMTDDTGIIQHAKYNIPDLDSGYCVDDNARALLAACLHYSLQKDKTIVPLLERYLAFLCYAFNRENNFFRNFMSYDRRWLDLRGSEDSHARALWSLGVAIKYAPNDSVRNAAMSCFLDGLQVMENFRSPRAWAFAILGLQSYLRKYGGDSYARKLRAQLAQKLFALFSNNGDDGWLWCEDIITYANAKLPHALIVAGQAIPDPKMLEAGLRILEWLLQIQTHKDGHLSIIGNAGWYRRNGEKANFGQQPAEAMNLIDACVDAYLITGDKKWHEEAEHCFGWFMGQNDVNTNIYNFETGGCCDGLEHYGVNQNQGAESTLSWLIALLRMYESVGMKGLVKKKKSK